MAHYLALRCKTAEDVEALVELLVAEFKARDWPHEIGNGETAYYTASDIAEDCSRLTVIELDPEVDEDE